MEVKRIDRAATNTSGRVCAVCGSTIDDRRQVRLLRDADASPEDPSVFHVHDRCVSKFVARQHGHWAVHRVPSLAASWLLPSA